MTTLTNSNISGILSSPASVLSRGMQASQELVIKDGLEVDTGDLDSADIIHLCAVPWTAKIHSIVLFNDDLDAHATPTLACDVGLYKMTADGTKTVLDADAYASAITTLQAANKTGVEVAFESGVKDINAADLKKQVFEDAGLTAIPSGHALLSLTLTAASATAAAGTIGFVVRYTM